MKIFEKNNKVWK